MVLKQRGADSPPAPFDRRILRLRRERRLAAADFPEFLYEEMAVRLIDRLADIRRQFHDVLELAAGRGLLSQKLVACPQIGRLVRVDSAFAASQHSPAPFVQAEEEALPFRPASFDAVVAAGGLHFVNDLPGALAQIAAVLRPDGLFLAVFFGGETLWELRRALMLAELELTGGATARVAPFVDLADAAALLQRAGFALPVADLDRLTVSYRDPIQLLADLRAMGESGAPRLSGGAPLRRAVLGRALAIYRQEFGDAEGRVPATFDLIWMTGWRPHPSQPRPRPRGSGTVDLADFLGRKGSDQCSRMRPDERFPAGA